MTASGSPALEQEERAAFDLAAEGRLLGKYLLRSEPVGTALERYAAACRGVLGTHASPADRAMQRFIGRHPWTLPFLDATAALLDPQALLRKKLFLMLSILETLPLYADVFTPKPRARWIVILSIAWLGGLNVLMLAFGLLIYGWSRRAR